MTMFELFSAPAGARIVPANLYLSGCLRPIGRGAALATWRSGYAAVCKTVYAGSIPAVASTPLPYPDP